MMKIKTSFVAIIIVIVCCQANKLGPINYVFIDDDYETTMKNPQFSKFRDFIRETFQVGKSEGDTYEAGFVCGCEEATYWNSITFPNHEYCDLGMILGRKGKSM